MGPDPPIKKQIRHPKIFIQARNKFQRCPDYWEETEKRRRLNEKEHDNVQISIQKCHKGMHEFIGMPKLVETFKLGVSTVPVSITVTITKKTTMSDKFFDKYRISSARATWWDYTQNGMYFITICTAHREHYFGEIVKTPMSAVAPVETPKLGVSATSYTTPSKISQQHMQLSGIGEIAHQYWTEIPDHFQFVKLDVFVVMPNHVHGIVIIDKSDDDNDVPKIDHPHVGTPVETSVMTPVETPKLGVSTIHNTAPTATNKPKTGGKNEEWKRGTLGVIINQYKRKCTIESHKIHADFQW